MQPYVQVQQRPLDPPVVPSAGRQPIFSGLPNYRIAASANQRPYSEHRNQPAVRRIRSPLFTPIQASMSKDNLRVFRGVSSCLFDYIKHPPR